MAFPAGITTRPVSVGGAMILESSGLLAIWVEIRATKSLVRESTGYRFEKLAVTSKGEPGAEVVIQLPVTDQSGWKDPALNAVIDVTAPNSYTHQYTATVTFRDVDGNLIGVPGIELGPFVVPTGDGSVIDLDKNVPASTIAGGSVSIPDIWSVQIAQALAIAEDLNEIIPTTSAAVATAITTPGAAQDALNATIDALIDEADIGVPANVPRVIAETDAYAEVSYEAGDGTEPGNPSAGVTPDPGIEGIPLWGFGNSYMADGFANTRYMDRVAQRHGMFYGDGTQPVWDPALNSGAGGVAQRQRTNWAVNGTYALNIASEVRRRFPIGSTFSRGVVVIEALTNDGAKTGWESFTKLMLASMINWVRQASHKNHDDASITYAGTWTTYSSSPNYRKSTTAGDTAQFAVTGDEFSFGYLALPAGHSLGAGTFTVTVDGVLKATVDTDATPADISPSWAFPRIKGLGAGAHNVVIANTSGTIYLEGYGVPATRGPSVVLMKARIRQNTAPVIARFEQMYADSDALAAEYAEVITVDCNTGFDNTWLLADALHPDDQGKRWIADRLDEALLEHFNTFAAGQHQLT